jgi:hypothetical protein
VSRRPEPLEPTTSMVEWDAKGPHAARALIALLSSSFGRGVSSIARFWTGRIAVTEHIPGLSADESLTHARGRQKGHTDPGVASGWAARLDHGGDRGSPGRFMHGLGASGAVCLPQGNGAAAPSSALRAIDPSARPRSWRTFGPRHLRRQSEPDLVATQCGAASCRGQPSPSQVEG